MYLPVKCSRQFVKVQRECMHDSARAMDGQACGPFQDRHLVKESPDDHALQCCWMRVRKCKFLQQKLFDLKLSFYLGNASP